MTETDARLPALEVLFDPAQRADPYPAYERWRTETPIARPHEQVFVLSRHRDCATVLRDARFGHAEPDQVTPFRRPVADEDALLDERGRPVRSFLGLNPPDHTRLRKLVSQAFTRPMVARLEPRIRSLTTELVDAAMAQDGPVDLIEALAYPLPVAVISELLAIPAEDRDRFVSWSHALARGLDPDFLLPPEVREAQLRARREFAGYVRELAEVRRRDPGDDLLSALVQVHDSDDVLSETELVATCILLLIAGHETTVNLIGNGTLALLRDPAELDRLRAEPELTDRAVEELLRYDSPVQLTLRFALADAEVGGVAVPAGSVCLLLIGSANRDPDAHERPDRLDVGREPSRHLAFGQGVHFCLGAPLARLEAQIVFRELLSRAPALRPAGTPGWKDNVVLRGVRDLPVTLH
jgi:cytochrome P450